MARPGDVVINPLTGERVTFRAVAAQTGGSLLELESRWPRSGFRAAAHVHPGMEERFEVVAGTPCFRIDGLERTLSPGDVLVVPPGTAHEGWNAGGLEVVLAIEFRPALRWEEFVVRYFADPARLPGLLAEFAAEVAPA